MIAAFAEQYAAILLISVTTVRVWITRLTSLRSSHNTQLTSHIHDSTSTPFSPIVSLQWLLINHHFQLLPRTQPRSTIIYINNMIEFLQSHLMGFLCCSQNAGAIYCIVDAREPFNGFAEEVSNCLGGGYVGGNGEELGVGVGFGEEFLGCGEGSFGDVGEDDAGATFLGEGCCCCFTDTWYSFVR